MAELIYGVDPEGEVTPVKVRDAIVECFFQAKCVEDVRNGGLGLGKPEVIEIVQKAFRDAGGDFDRPTKRDILATMAELAKIAGRFHDAATIQNHMERIGVLISRL